MKILHLFVGLLALQLLLLFSIDYLLVSDDLYYVFFNQLDTDRISSMIESGKKWKWLSYVLIPVFLIVKLFLVSICLSIGGLLTRVEDGFRQFFKAVVYAEFIFLTPVILKLIWFVFFDVNYSLEDLQYFSPLSAFSFFNPEEIEPWLVYPIQLLNIFELFYWLALAYQLKDVLGKSFKASLGFVAATYGVGLFIWVVLITFLIVTIT